MELSNWHHALAVFSQENSPWHSLRRLCGSSLDSVVKLKTVEFGYNDIEGTERFVSL
jgi:hypothetical protein